MTDMEQRAAAKAFVADWQGRGDEKQDTQSFWLALLQKVYGVAEPEKYIRFEVRVKIDNTDFIDGLIEKTHVLIEQKSYGINLRKGIKQSNGSMLTPYGQARRYAGSLPHNQNPRWIVVCNFEEFWIYDMNRPNDDPEILKLANLEKEYSRLNFLVDTGDENIKREIEISIQAGELVGRLYDAFLKQYKEPESEHAQKSLNMLCVRLVFCMYAEDAGIFGKPNMFHDYMSKRGVQAGRRALIDLFRVLDCKPDERDPYLADDDPDLAAFPYVNGGLFSDEDIEIPPFNDEIFALLLSRASECFDWSEISPTIFGAVFESTLNPETRRKGGMHYTSIENIHKVIDPLFMDDLKAEFETIKQDAVLRTRRAKLTRFQDKLAGLKFLDPACGSGNFLTETYLSLRKMENEVLELLLGGQIAMGFENASPIKVSIQQFYGIEINNFAVTVAKTALWIAESQMMKRTEDIVHMNLDFLPLKTYTKITEGNALRIDWETVISKYELNYIMGNPPFVGYSLQSKEQKEDILSIYVDEKGKPYKTTGKIDYVAGWYFKAAQMMQGTRIRTALVSTNSITQGEQVASVWKPLYDRFGIHIDFAHRTFRWDSEASMKAHVHCVIVGFSCAESQSERKLFNGDSVQLVHNINPYLLAAPDIFVTSRNKVLCDVPDMIKGSSPVDGGNLLFSDEERYNFISKEPRSQKLFKRFFGAREYIHNERRWCLWLENISPAEINSMPMVKSQLLKVQEFRLNSTKEATRKYAAYPFRFMELRQPQTDYILVPRHSSELRKYIPCGFMSKDDICGDANNMIPNATIFQFGVIMSNVHMAWVKNVCGRIKSDYRYSNDIVYNNFPWPTPTAAQKARIEQTAQAILDARALYPDCSLADLYDQATMPPELIKAHQDNDRAVMDAYGMPVNGTNEASCVAWLMRMYQKLTQK